MSGQLKGQGREALGHALRLGIALENHLALEGALAGGNSVAIPRINYTRDFFDMKLFCNKGTAGPAI